MIRDGDFHSQLPITGSHEPCGTVVEVGSEVQGFKRVIALGLYRSCIPVASVQIVNSDHIFTVIRWKEPWESALMARSERFPF
jgi:NADPH:quinone reductase-like Zn-dependent oxidoreductase